MSASRPHRPCLPITVRAAVACGVLLGALRAGAIVNGEPPAEDDRRFDAVAAFSRTHWLGLDPTHENATEHNHFGNATLIAPDAVILSKHLLPKGDKPPPQGMFAVRFRRRPDGGLGSRKDGPASYHQVKIARFITSPDSDLAIGVLFDPVTHIEPMEMDLADNPMVETPGLIAAWGSRNNFLMAPSPRGELRIGANRFLHAKGSGSIRFMDLQAEPREWKKNEETGEPINKPYVTSEAGIANLYDSGGAILIENEQGELRLIGVIATITGGPTLAQHHGDDTFPLHLIDPSQTDTVPKRPYKLR